MTLEFLAGLIVGEGCYILGIAKQKSGSMEIRPAFSLRMNDIDTIDLVCDSFKHHGLALYRNPNTYARCATVSVSGVKRMRRHLEVFLPLLTGKKLEAAEIVSQFIDRRLTDAFWKRYTEEDIAFIDRLREVNGPSARRTSTDILRDYMRKTDGKAPSIKR